MTGVGLAADTLRIAFGHFPSGVAAVCAHDGRTPVGLAISTFVPVSLDPPLVGICVQRSSRTWPVLRELTHLGVSVLADGHHGAALSLAARDGDRFASVAFTVAGTGAIRITGAPAYFECALVEEVPAGDHVFALLRIAQVDVAEEGEPLVFHRSRFGRLAARHTSTV
jgi:flavin reductase (DIM6/NTAB) family NADH-FMN oxidoreductase RutF